MFQSILKFIQDNYSADSNLEPFVRMTNYYFSMQLDAGLEVDYVGRIEVDTGSSFLEHAIKLNLVELIEFISKNIQLWQNCSLVNHFLLNSDELLKFAAFQSNPNIEILKILIINRASPKKYFIDVVNHCSTEVVKILFKAHDINVNTLFSGQLTALSIAAAANSVSLTKYFIEQGCDINAQYFMLNGNLSNPSSIPMSFALGCEPVQYDLIKLLLDSGTEFHGRPPHTFDVMGVAIMNNNIQLIRQVLEKGIDINAKLKYFNMSALMFAVCKSPFNIEVIQFLLENHADVNCRRTDNPVFRNCTLIMLLVEFMRDIKYQPIFDLLIKHPDLNLTLNDNMMNGVIIYAAKFGDLNLVKRFVDKDPNILHSDFLIRSPYYNTDSLEIVQYLIEKGLGLDGFEAGAFTALEIAIATQNVSVVRKCIANGWDVNHIGQNGFSPLTYCLRSGQNEEIYNLLRRAGAKESDNINPAPGFVQQFYKAYKAEYKKNLDDSEESIKLRRTIQETAPLEHQFIQSCKGEGVQVFNLNEALLKAVNYKHIDTVMLLLIVGADIQYKNEFGANALFIALRENHLEIIAFLKSRGMKLKDACDNCGYSAQHLCAERGNLDELKNAFNEERVIRVCNNGQTPLVNAALEGHLECVKYLVSVGCDVNEKSIHGDTAIAAAITAEAGPVVKYLVEKGAKVNGLRPGYYNVLELAIGNNKINLAEYALNNGFNVNRRNLNDDDIHPIHIAVQQRSIEMVQFLLNRGADILATFSEGSALLIAAQNEDIPMMTFLIQNGIDINHCLEGKPTALHTSVFLKKLNSVKYLLQQGANPIKTAKVPWNRRIQFPFNDVVSYYSPICDAFRLGYLDILDELLKHNADRGIRIESIYSSIDSCERVDYRVPLREFADKRSRFKIVKHYNSISVIGSILFAGLIYISTSLILAAVALSVITGLLLRYVMKSQYESLSTLRAVSIDPRRYPDQNENPIPVPEQNNVAPNAVPQPSAQPQPLAQFPQYQEPKQPEPNKPFGHFSFKAESDATMNNLADERERQVGGLDKNEPEQTSNRTERPKALMF